MKTNGILAISLVALFATGAARADIASTTYVDGKIINAANYNANQGNDTLTPTIRVAEDIAAMAADAAVESAVENIGLEYATKEELGAETDARTAADTALGTRIDNEVKARSDADTAINAKFGDLGNKTVAQAIADAQTNATYNDTEVRGLISANTTAIGKKQDALTTGQLAAVNSGVTTTTVTQVATNKSDIAAIKTEQGTQNTDIATLKTGKQNTLETTGAGANLKGAGNVSVVKDDQGVITITGTEDTALAGRVGANETAIETINNSAVMKSGVTTSTVTQVTTNKNDIAAIKTEQGTQNTNIANLQSGKQDKLVAASVTTNGTGNVISNVTAADGKITITKTNVATADTVTSAISALDGNITGDTGIVKTISQTDGVVTATRGLVAKGEIGANAVTSDNIESVASSKVTGLQALATMEMPAACETNECALVYNKTTKKPEWQVVR